MRFSVCIPTTRPSTLASAIDSVKRQTHEDWELIVVGQGDERSLRQCVERANGGSRIRYVHSERRGASCARNRAFAESTGEVVAFLDDDCEAREDWLAVVARCFEERPELGLVGGALVAPDGVRGLLAVCPNVEPKEVLYDPARSGRPSPPGWEWVTANFAIRRDVALRVGPLDESLGAGTRFAAAEDTDYLLRLEALGTLMLTTPRSVVYHTHGARRGLRAVYDHKRNYARGNGALAAKLTLLGDPRGREWVRGNVYMATLGRIRERRPHQLPLSLFRLYHFMRGYRECLSGYSARRLDGSSDHVSVILEPSNSSPPRR